MEKYAVFVDIDGTLLNTKHMISEESKETIRLLKENGLDNTLHEGENVSFSIADGQKGPMAINVHKL